MSNLSTSAAKAIYRQAIDATARDNEGEGWWQEVTTEIEAVVSAPTANQAARLISWWHNDWAAVNDSPIEAARRIRSATKAR